MYERSLPPTAEAIDTVRRWARNTAGKHHPGLASGCECVVSRLIANAVPRTRENGVIAVVITPTDNGLRVEVRDPGNPVKGSEADEWSEVSALTASYGCGRTRDGHVAWAELRSRTHELLIREWDALGSDALPPPRCPDMKTPAR